MIEFDRAMSLWSTCNAKRVAVVKQHKQKQKQKLLSLSVFSAWNNPISGLMGMARAREHSRGTVCCCQGLEFYEATRLNSPLGEGARSCPHAYKICCFERRSSCFCHEYGYDRCQLRHHIRPHIGPLHGRVWHRAVWHGGIDPTWSECSGYRGSGEWPTEYRWMGEDGLSRLSRIQIQRHWRRAW